MRPTVKFGALPFAFSLVIASIMPAASRATDLLSADSIDQLAARRFWQMTAPVPADDRITRTVLLDDNLYLLTEKNLVYAVHAMTGVIRWTALAADPGQTLRGPTHSGQYVLFTGPGSVKVLDRATGDLASEPRTLRGVIIEIKHDIATISIGRAHGLRADDVLDIYPVGTIGEDPSRVVAQLLATEVGERQSKGKVIRASRIIKVEPGMRLAANVNLPLRSVKLPFAATSPAIADSNNIFIGSANQRVYSMDILGGYRNWETTVPKTVTAAPLLVGDELYFGSQGGIVTSATLGTGKRAPARRKWEFETEGPIFYEMAADAERLYVASNDRLLYAIDRATGRRVWAERFDNPPDAAPIVAGDHVFQTISGLGLFCIEAKTGKRIWHLPEPAHYLAHFGKDCYVFAGSSYPAVVRLDEATGKIKTRESAPLAQFAQASPVDQLILLADGRGTVMCIRPKTAPALQPSALAAVLQNDAKARDMARMTAEQRALAQSRAQKPEDIKRPDIKFIEEDDLFGSRSTAKPAGGSGLVEVDEKDAANEKDAVEKDKAEADSTDEADEDKESSDEEESADEGSADEDDSDSDEKGDDEEAESDEEESDEEGEEKDDGEKESGDEGDDEGDDEGGDEDEEGDEP